MSAQAGSAAECIDYASEEFRTLVSDDIATYLARGLRFNKSVYKEICQILKDFDTVASKSTQSRLCRNHSGLGGRRGEYGVPHYPIFSAL